MNFSYCQPSPYEMFRSAAGTGKIDPMNIDAREKLFRLNDDSDEAMAIRLTAARITAGYKTMTEFSTAAGINYQTYVTQEKKGRPAAATVRYLYRNHRIDYNYVYNGDFNHLPGDVQSALEKALSELSK